MENSLEVKCLSLTNDEKRRVGRERLDGVSFVVSTDERILIVGGAASGKTSLLGAIDRNNSLTYAPSFVSYSSEVIVRRVNSEQDLPAMLMFRDVVLKDGFQLENEDHWRLLDRIRSAGATLIAATEIHRLEYWRPLFGRVMLVLNGRIHADGMPTEIKRWIQRNDLTQFDNSDQMTLQSWNP